MTQGGWTFQDSLPESPDPPTQTFAGSVQGEAGVSFASFLFFFASWLVMKAEHLVWSCSCGSPRLQQVRQMGARFGRLLESPVPVFLDSGGGGVWLPCFPLMAEPLGLRAAGD